MKIVARVYVKFRAFGITFGTVDQTFEEPLPELNVVVPARKLINWSGRGVLLTVDLAKK